MNKKRLAAAIAKRRKELGLTNEEAGKKAGFDSPSVAKQTLYRAQNKPEEVSAGSMLAIARSMGVPKDIFDLVTEVQPSHTFYEVRNPDQLAAFANDNSINYVIADYRQIKKSDAIDSIKYLQGMDFTKIENENNLNEKIIVNLPNSLNSALKQANLNNISLLISKLILKSYLMEEWMIFQNYWE